MMTGSSVQPEDDCIRHCLQSDHAPGDLHRPCPACLLAPLLSRCLEA